MFMIDVRTPKLKFWLTAGGFCRLSGRIACAVLLYAVCPTAPLTIDDQPKRFSMAGTTDAESAIADESDTLRAEVQGVCRLHATPFQPQRRIQLHFVQQSFTKVLAAIAIGLGKHAERASPVCSAAAFGRQRAQGDTLAQGKCFCARPVY